MEIFCHTNVILDLLLNKSIISEWWVSLLNFISNDKKLLYHTDQINEHNNSLNNKIHTYDQIRTMVVNLGRKKGENNKKFILN